MSNRRDKIIALVELIRLDRPIGSILLLSPTLWALWLASEGQPPARYTLIFIMGVFLMRSIGCAINDWFDRDIDPSVERTKSRPLARGALNGKDVAILVMVGFALALFLLVQLPRGVIIWAVIAAILTIIYPLFKRFTNMPQAVLGLAFAWSIPMVYTALGTAITAVTWCLFLANFFWVLYYDTAYAMSDREDDLKVGVKSTAILLGQNDVKALILLQALTLGLLIVVGIMAGLNRYYYVCLFIASLFFMYQFALYRTRERLPCFRAFINNGWFGVTVFLGFLLGFSG